MTDWAQLYRANVSAVTALANDLTDDELATTVPGSPAWTVRDVIAHLAGGQADVVTGRMDGAPAPEWTARHVGERVGLAVADLVSEIREHAEPLVEVVADSPRPAPIWDIVVHHADLHEALGKKELPQQLWRPVLDAVAPVLLGERSVTVQTGEAVYGAGGTELAVPAYELFRTLFSRRSRGQIASWAGDALSADEICVFGARDDEQPIPS
jgi:uncharacterized protein (TIGR03083 family)